ncbi:hypothetical protein Pelo_6993 [Pelomyxa schiedti]|nr:hypothetical protein Pelo_6993 [Pelomyxa schiedti]
MDNSAPVLEGLEENLNTGAIPPHQLRMPAIPQAENDHPEAGRHHQPLPVHVAVPFLPLVAGNIQVPVIAGDTVVHVVPLRHPAVDVRLRRCTPQAVRPVDPPLITPLPQSRMMGGGVLNPDIHDTQQQR